MFRLSFSSPVHRISLAAGFLAAALCGSIPFAGLEPNLVMGRVVAIPAAFAFFLHLGLAIFYGICLTSVACHSRDGWTLAVVSLGAFASDRATTFLLSSLGFPTPLWDSNAFAAHSVFCLAFIGMIKIAEIGSGD